MSVATWAATSPCEPGAGATLMHDASPLRSWMIALQLTGHRRLCRSTCTLQPRIFILPRNRALQQRLLFIEPFKLLSSVSSFTHQRQALPVQQFKTQLNPF
ncbi:hypothetical protein GOP47_0022328 [Adiantum capillus-veneris]|uniref:Uncharacterized protein n=1 Tax=Adiantum capillus-veneris TaxID=13818 RepID=A0A9D4U542_ADICA|nr:hypothetical protein GOP47_0022328 [Adiantum capillus-veneris]